MRWKYLALVPMLLCGAVNAVANDVSSWSGNASLNTAPPPNGVPENIAPSRVAPTAREIMAAVARWYGHINAANATGTGNSQVLTYSPAVTSCGRGEMFAFFPVATNTGFTTLTIGGCAGPVRIGATALSGGEIVAGRVAMVFYDGAAFQLLSGGAGGGTPPVGVIGTLAIEGGGCLALEGGGCLGLNP